MDGSGAVSGNLVYLQPIGGRAHGDRPVYIAGDDKAIGVIDEAGQFDLGFVDGELCEQEFVLFTRGQAKQCGNQKRRCNFCSYCIGLLIGAQYNNRIGYLKAGCWIYLTIILCTTVKPH